MIELLIYVGLLALTGGFLTSILLVTVRIQNQQISSYEVTSQSNFILGSVKRLIGWSSAIEIETGKPLNYLKLRTENPQKDPTYIVLRSDKQIEIKEGGGASTTLTTAKINVDALQFTKFSSYPGHDTVQINLAASYNSANPQFAFSQVISSAISRISAATFDDSLTPGASNSYDLGQPLVAWRNAYFGGNLAVDTNTLFVNSLNDRVGIGTANPRTKLEVVNGAISSSNNGETILINSDANNPSIELRDTDGTGLMPYIDFSNDAVTDFDARLILRKDYILTLEGADFEIRGTPTDKKVLRVFNDDGSGDAFTRPNQIQIRGVTNQNIKGEIGIDTTLKALVIGALEETVGWRDIILANNGGNVGIGTINPKEKLHVKNGYIYISNPGLGFILKSPDGTCGRVTLTNAEALAVTAITCPL